MKNFKRVWSAEERKRISRVNFDREWEKTIKKKAINFGISNSQHKANEDKARKSLLGSEIHAHQIEWVSTRRDVTNFGSSSFVFVRFPSARKSLFIASSNSCFSLFLKELIPPFIYYNYIKQEDFFRLLILAIFRFSFSFPSRVSKTKYFSVFLVCVCVPSVSHRFRFFVVVVHSRSTQTHCISFRVEEEKREGNCLPFEAV